MKNKGLQGVTITTRGYGEDRLVVPNEKPDGTTTSKLSKRTGGSRSL